MEKKFEVAGFRNKRESLKFVTMDHICNKIQYSMKKDTDFKNMSDKSEDAVALKNL